MDYSKISKIGLGGAALSGEGGGYGFGDITEEAAEKLLKAAWDYGITLYDTAPIYGFGLSEERMGRYLSKEAYIVTKGGVSWHPNKRVNMSNEPKIIEQMLIESLKRLKREQIDLYMIHWPDPRVDIRHPMELLARYQEKGVIKEIGLCNTNEEDFTRAEEIVKVTAIQSEFNLFKNDTFSIPRIQEQNIFTMGWGTFDKGILSGRVTKERKFESSDCRSWAPWWNNKEVQKKLDQIELFKKELEQKELDLKLFALHYSLRHISCSLVGSKNPTDLKNIIELNEKKIPEDNFNFLTQRWQKVLREEM